MSEQLPTAPEQAFLVTDMADQIIRALGSRRHGDSWDFHDAIWSDTANGNRYELQRFQPTNQDYDAKRTYYLRIYESISDEAHDFYRFFSRDREVVHRCDSEWDRLPRNSDGVAPKNALQTHLATANVQVDAMRTRQGIAEQFTGMICVYALTDPRIQEHLLRFKSYRPGEESFVTRRRLIRNMSRITGHIFAPHEVQQALTIAREIDAAAPPIVD